MSRQKRGVKIGGGVMAGRFRPAGESIFQNFGGGELNRLLQSFGRIFNLVTQY